MAQGRSLRGRRREPAEPLGLTMRKMLLLGIAAVLSVVAVSAWSGPRSTQAEITTSGIDTFVLMRNSLILKVQQYDAF
jgi:hypothetical protein